MNVKENVLVTRTDPLPLIFTIGIVLTVFIVLLCACGGSQSTIYDSLEEVKKLAAEKDTWIVVEFWRHG